MTKELKKEHCDGCPDCGLGVCTIAHRVNSPVYHCNKTKLKKPLWEILSAIDFSPENIENTRNFIRQTIQQERQELVEEIDRRYVEGYKHGSGSIVADVNSLETQYNKGVKDGSDRCRKEILHIITALVEKEYPHLGAFANRLCGDIESHIEEDNGKH